jgi:dihydrofolate synthase/folylpolyglutamate synthase
VITADEITGIRFDYHGKHDSKGLAVPLAGRHQAMNAAVAVRTIEEITTAYPELRCDIRKGLRETSWPGRLEFVKDHPPVLVDGAHNPQAAVALAEYLKKALDLYSRIILVLGIMGDKDREGIMKPLIPLASEVIVTAPGYGRAASPHLLAAEARSMGAFPKTAPTVAEAIAMAEGLCTQGDLIVVTGSFYTIGEAKEALGQTGVLARLRE